ncbi:MAG: IS4 family transposase, partial [Gammaproteobacteria bacterium]|nr:IS4 family transposase [Gammaproteobacteria bacterium]
MHSPEREPESVDSTKRIVRKQIETLRSGFFQIDKRPFRDILPKETLDRIAVKVGNYRDKVFNPLVTLKTFLRQVLGDNGSCKEAVANVLPERVRQGLTANSMNTGPYCKARQRLPSAMLEEAVKQSGISLHRESESSRKRRNYNVVIADGTTVLMADSEENRNEFPQQSVQKAGPGFPTARIVGLISLGTGSIIDHALSAYQGKGSGESSLFSQVANAMGPGDLLPADRYYCTYAIVALTHSRGVPVLFKNHAKKKADFRQGKKLGSKDHLIHRKKPRRKPVRMSVEDYD